MLSQSSPILRGHYERPLVCIPQLTQRKSKLAGMKARPPRQRAEEQYVRHLRCGGQPRLPAYGRRAGYFTPPCGRFI